MYILKTFESCPHNTQIQILIATFLHIILLCLEITSESAFSPAFEIQFGLQSFLPRLIVYIFDQDENFIKDGNHKSLICLSYQSSNGNQQNFFADSVKFKRIIAARSFSTTAFLACSTKRQNDIQYNVVWKERSG